MADALLQVEGLEAGYGEVQVLWGISLKAQRGQLTTIVGANGAGKNQMLRAVAGTIAPWGGRVTFEGEDVTRLATSVRSRPPDHRRDVARPSPGAGLSALYDAQEAEESGAHHSPRRAKRASRIGGE